jgi:3-methylfumaryl-CoA hydratase
MNDEAAELSNWVGRREVVRDDLAVTQAQAAAAMFDLNDEALHAGQALPPLWHWFYFLPRAQQARLDRDGHPTRGGFLPPITLPRRMFAGSRVRFHAPLVLGTPAEREGTIKSVSLKSGRSGALAFVTVGYRFMQHGTLCVEEEQDIVYREVGARVAAPDVREWSTPPAGAVTRDVHADSRLLFRFSALTFNAHRIHYDRAYAIEEEGYPGLVVHGPLTAMLLSQLAHTVEASEAERAQRTPRIMTSFSFRGVSPLFDTAAFRLQAIAADTVATLEAIGPDSATAIRADAAFDVRPPEE